MPIYEYRCDPCDQTFEALIRSSRDVARCPTCGGERVSKQFSVPAAAQTGGASASSPLPMAPPGGCGRPQCGSGGCGFE